MIQEDLILIWLHLQRPAFQKRPHPEVLRVRIETCFLGAENTILFAIIMQLFQCILEANIRKQSIQTMIL